MSGDLNPTHVHPEYAASTQFHGAVAHGMWTSVLISTALGTAYPGPGTVCLAKDLRFLQPVRVGDTLDVRVMVARKDRSNRHVTLGLPVGRRRCTALRRHGIGKAPVAGSLPQVRSTLNQAETTDGNGHPCSVGSRGGS
jgi:acyl dehydratase